MIILRKTRISFTYLWLGLRFLHQPLNDRFNPLRLPGYLLACKHRICSSICIFLLSYLILHPLAYLRNLIKNLVTLLFSNICKRSNLECVKLLLIIMYYKKLTMESSLLTLHGCFPLLNKFLNLSQLRR